MIAMLLDEITPFTRRLLTLLINGGRGQRKLHTATLLVQQGAHKPLSFYVSGPSQSDKYCLLHMACRAKSVRLLHALLFSPSFRQLSPNKKEQIFKALLTKFGGKAYHPLVKTLILAMTRQGLLVPPPLREDIIHAHHHPREREASFRHHLADFPTRELWRFFCDSCSECDDPLGWYNYESRESGYIRGMFNAFLTLMHSVSEPLTPGLIERLHQKATAGVGGMLSELVPGAYQHTSRQRPYVPFFFDSNGSLRGFVDSQRRAVKDGYRFIGAHRSNGVPYLKHQCIKRAASFYPYKMQLTLRAYQQALHNAQTPTAVLKAIVRLIMKLSRIHPFKDGNTRVFVMLLLQRELMINGFPPSIVDDPNQFDGHSCEELMAQVVDGFERFTKIKQGHGLWHGMSSRELLQRVYVKKGFAAERVMYEAMINYCSANVFAPAEVRVALQR